MVNFEKYLATIYNRKMSEKGNIMCNGEQGHHTVINAEVD
jgi:hypothetical protein